MAGQPDPDTPVPPPVHTWAAGRPLVAVCENELGGLTYRVDTADPVLFVKWQPAGTDIDLEAEIRRLQWAAAFIDVPAVLEAGTAADGALHRATWSQDHRHLDVDSALRLLSVPPPIDKLVVCHGDACAPNTLVNDDGSFAAHVDLGALGVADRWADLAIATWSLEWNFGPGWELVLLESYGIAPDPVRTAYYRLLWDLG